MSGKPALAGFSLSTPLAVFAGQAAVPGTSTGRRHYAHLNFRALVLILGSRGISHSHLGRRRRAPSPARPSTECGECRRTSGANLSVMVGAQTFLVKSAALMLTISSAANTRVQGGAKSFARDWTIWLGRRPPFECTRGLPFRGWLRSAHGAACGAAQGSERVDPT
jgi:hypothetical protein